MRLLKRLAFAAVACLCVAAAPARGSAASIWNEGVDGDLSNSRLAPTVLGSLAAGSNTVSATSVAGDREYFTLTVPAGFQLDAIVLTAYTSVNFQSFVGIQGGATFTEPPTGTNVANLLGYTHFNAGLVGTSILDDMGAGFGTIGFTPPLPAGAYTLWSQEVGTSPASYGFDFQLSAVPEPATLALVVLGLGALAGARPRRR